MRQPGCALSDPPDEQSRAVADEPTVLEPSKKPVVLVVDDEHMVRIMVQLGLERNGFDVWLARNGREAIDLYRAHAEQIAVVLLDVCMPGLDGLATLTVLRELNPEVVSCLMGSESGACHPEKLLQQGAAYVIPKPFRLDDLASIIRLLAHRVSADLRPSGRVCRR
jgi:two-component system, cell cycle sensor histidine kinase and response regulator CckA